MSVRCVHTLDSERNTGTMLLQAPGYVSGTYPPSLTHTGHPVPEPLTSFQMADAFLSNVTAGSDLPCVLTDCSKT